MNYCQSEENFGMRVVRDVQFWQ